MVKAWRAEYRPVSGLASDSHARGEQAKQKGEQGSTQHDLFELRPIGAAEVQRMLRFWMRKRPAVQRTAPLPLQQVCVVCAQFSACAACCWAKDSDLPLSCLATTTAAPIATAPATMYLASIAASAPGRNLKVW